MGWLRGSFYRLEGRLLAELRTEAAEAAAAANGSAANGTAAPPQAVGELPPCVQRYLELADAASCKYKSASGCDLCQALDGQLPAFACCCTARPPAQPISPPACPPHPHGSRVLTSTQIGQFKYSADDASPWQRMKVTLVGTDQSSLIAVHWGSLRLLSRCGSSRGPAMLLLSASLVCHNPSPATICRAPAPQFLPSTGVPGAPSSLSSACGVRPAQ